MCASGSSQKPSGPAAGNQPARRPSLTDAPGLPPRRPRVAVIRAAVVGIAALAAAALVWRLSTVPGRPADRPDGTTAVLPFDSTPPRIVKLKMPPPNTTYFGGAVLEFAVEFDEPVVVTGQPELAFELGFAVASGSRRARFVGGSGTPTLRFAYRVVATDASNDGLMATGLITTTGTVEDTAGNAYDGRFERVPSGHLEIQGASAIYGGSTRYTSRARQACRRIG